MPKRTKEQEAYLRKEAAKKPLAPPSNRLPIYNPEASETEPFSTEESQIRAERQRLIEYGQRYEREGEERERQERLKRTRLRRKKAKAKRRQDNPLRKRVRQRISQSIKAQEQSRAVEVRGKTQDQKIYKEAGRIMERHLERQRKGASSRRPEKHIRRSKLQSGDRLAKRELREIDENRIIRGLKKAQARASKVSEVTGKAGKVMGPAAIYFAVKDAFKAKKEKEGRKKLFMKLYYPWVQTGPPET